MAHADTYFEDTAFLQTRGIYVLMSMLPFRPHTSYHSYMRAYGRIVFPHTAGVHTGYVHRACSTWG